MKNTPEINNDSRVKAEFDKLESLQAEVREFETRLANAQAPATDDHPHHLASQVCDGASLATVKNTVVIEDKDWLANRVEIGKHAIKLQGQRLASVRDTVAAEICAKMRPGYVERLQKLVTALGAAANAAAEVRAYRNSVEAAISRPAGSLLPEGNWQHEHHLRDDGGQNQHKRWLDRLKVKYPEIKV